MNFSDLRAIVRRYDQHATIIFDREEPIGSATDLVMPGRRWFGHRNPSRRQPQPTSQAATVDS
jgi:hypothetical protein